MFDYVNYKALCPNCGTEIVRWQTKDGCCVAESLETWEVESFYSSCPKCGAWIDAKVEAEVEHIVKKCDIELSIDKKRTVL